MIVLPHGLYYGRVPTTEATSIVDRYLQGEIVEQYYRGRSSLSNVAQAAQSFARAASGDVRIGAFPPLREERIADGSWRVDLADDGEIVSVILRETLSAPLLSTCAATRPAPVREFALESMTGQPTGR